MEYKNEYYTKNSLKIFNELNQETNPQKFYVNALEKTRGMNIKKRQLANLIKIFEKKHEEDIHLQEKTILFINALINNSSEMS